MKLGLRYLLERLRCPQSGGPVSIHPTRLVGDSVRDAWIVSPAIGRVVGRIADFQLRFREVGEVPEVGEILGLGAPESQIDEPAYDLISNRDPRILRRGRWYAISDRLEGCDGQAGDEFEIQARDWVRLLVHAHPWSGRVELLVDGRVRSTHDLYHPHSGVSRTILVDGLPADRDASVVVRSTGTRHPESFGSQLILEQIVRAAVGRQPVRTRPWVSHFGAPFRAEFHEHFHRMPKDGVCLDYGGGRRTFEDPRYVNLEYADTVEADVVGDGLALPFQDDTFDMVYTTGVMEHVPDPLLGGREIHRVLKPGGVLVADIAFMQPVHSEGQHFFNATVWGAREIFRDLDIVDVRAEGSFAWMLEWMLETNGIKHHAPPHEVASFLESARRLESHIAPDKLLYVAPSIFVHASKRART